MVSQQHSDGQINPEEMTEVWLCRSREAFSHNGGNTSGRNYYTSDTIDTISFDILISLRKHELYSHGRKFARYRWGVTDSDANVGQGCSTNEQEAKSTELESSRGAGLRKGPGRKNKSNVRTAATSRKAKLNTERKS